MELTEPSCIQYYKRRVLTLYKYQCILCFTVKIIIQITQLMKIPRICRKHFDIFFFFFFFFFYLLLTLRERQKYLSIDGNSKLISTKSFIHLLLILQYILDFTSIEIH